MSEVEGRGRSGGERLWGQVQFGAIRSGRPNIFSSGGGGERCGHNFPCMHLSVPKNRGWGRTTRATVTVRVCPRRAPQRETVASYSD